MNFKSNHSGLRYQRRFISRERVRMTKGNFFYYTGDPETNEVLRETETKSQQNDSNKSISIET